MIWVAIVGLALSTVAPMVFLAWRGGRLRGRQEAAMRLHRAQLSELDRDLAEGRIVLDEHAAAKLEVQRRLLGDAGLADTVGVGSGRWPLVVTGALVPVAALGLYLAGGHPGFPPVMPPAPAANAAEQARSADEDEKIGQLRARLALMEPHAARTVEGYGVLGRAELDRGHLPEAAAAFQRVLAEKFDPDLAADTAEIMSQAAGGVTPEAAALFRRALAEGAADAPWRKTVEDRLREARGQ